MRRLFLVALLLVLCFSLMVFSAYADDGKLYLEGKLSKEGSATYLRINALESLQLSTFVLSLEYPSEVIEYSGYYGEKGCVLSVNSLEKGKITLVWFSEDGVLESDEKLFTLRFDTLSEEPARINIKTWDGLDTAGEGFTLSRDESLELLPQEIPVAGDLEVKKETTLYIKGNISSKDTQMSLVYSGVVVSVMLLWFLLVRIFGRRKQRREHLEYKAEDRRNVNEKD